MLRLSVFAGLAGLHLAVLQFCYFFLLLINVTSTYVTYITVVVAWMSGTLIGLLWRRLTPWPSMALGVLAYYLTCVLVLGAPLASQTLALAAIGVAITGLWAGHLFVALLPAFERVDRLFLHENNGFLLGIVVVFIGFTLLGMAFLLSAPLVSGLLQLAFLAWLRARPPQPGAAGVDDPLAGHGIVGRLADAAGRELRLLAGAAVVLNVLLPLATLADAALSGERYWAAFHGEDNAITWFSSIQLVLVGLTAYAVFQVSGLLAELGAGSGSRARWIWLVFTAGFIALGVDEHFELHEMLRDDVMREKGWLTDIAWIRPGDVGLLIYLGVGVAFGLIMLRELKRCRAALWLFLAAVATSATIVVIDVLPKAIVRSWPAPMFWNSVFEESGELLGQLLFLLSFLAFLSTQVREVGLRSGVARA